MPIGLESEPTIDISNSSVLDPENRGRVKQNVSLINGNFSLSWPLLCTCTSKSRSKIVQNIFSRVSQLLVLDMISKQKCFYLWMELHSNVLIIAINKINRQREVENILYFN